MLELTRLFSAWARARSLRTPGSGSISITMAWSTAEPRPRPRCDGATATETVPMPSSDIHAHLPDGVPACSAIQRRVPGSASRLDSHVAVLGGRDAAAADAEADRLGVVSPLQEHAQSRPPLPAAA